MKKIITFRTLCSCLMALAMMMVSQSMWAEYVKLTALDGVNSGNQESEYYEKLVDAKPATKWFSKCNKGMMYIIVKAEKAVVPDTYFLVTGNDISIYPDRNWASWKIYGGNFESDEQAMRNGAGWTLIDDHANVSLPTQNFGVANLGFNKNPLTAYQYYWIEVIKTAGADSQQMSEWGLGTYDEFVDATGAVNNVAINGIYYNLSGNEAEVTYKNTGYNSYFGNINIPYYVDYNGKAYTVTSIGDFAFNNCTGLTSVSIPNSVKAISYCAFQSCKSLTSVTIPNSVTSIRDGAFQECQSLTDVFCFAENVPTTASNAFDSSSIASTSLYVPTSSINSYKSTSPWSSFGKIVAIGEESGKDEPVMFTPLSNSGGYDGEGAVNLFDGETSTKWCSGFTNRQEGETQNGAYVIFKASRLMAPTHYSMTTGNDTFKYPGRNWKQWQVYGMNAESDADVTRNSSKWVALDKKYNVGTDELPAASCMQAMFSLSGGNGTPYRYFKVEIDQCVANGDMQMSEFTLGDEYTVAFETIVKTALINGINYILDNEEKVASVIPLSGTAKYSGCVSIPSSIMYEGESYTVAAIVNDTFNGCESLTSVTIPESVTSIGERAFCDCKSLTSVTLPSGLTRISVGTFWATKLTSIIIPEGVTSIEQDAFNDCRNLKSVTLPNSLTNIGGAAFYACSGLTEITIPENVKEIVGHAFYGCSSLTSITIPNSVTSIGNATFYGCTSLASASIGSGVTSIGESAFRKCSNLTSIALPEGVETIENYLFENCSKLASIRVPSSLKRVKTGAFSGCTSISKVIVSDIAAWCGIIYDGDNYAADFPLGRAHHLYCDENTEIQNLVIPKGVTRIEPRAFRDAEFITSVTLPNSLTNIEAEAFRGMSRLNSIIIPNGVTSIGNFAFMDCDVLTSVTFGNNIKNIGNSAFYNCTCLKKVIVTDIAAWCHINFSMFISDDQYYIGTNPLEYSQHLYSDETTEITDLVIPEGVTSIGEGQFYGCTGLTSVNIPNSLTSIDRYAFYKCSNMKDFYCHAKNVPSTASNAFNKSSIASATLYVPAGSLNQYKTTSPWSGFGNIQPIQEYTLTYMVDGEVFKTYEVEYGSVITPEPTPTKEGYTFSGWYGLPTTMPAQDVVVTGFFIANNYTLTYMVDGEAYKIYTVACGTKITPEPAPIKEGYSFSGWSYIPSTMPASDVVVVGSFSINSYTLSYIVDGEEYKTETLVYGSTITPEEEPSKEGYTFSGWSEIPETMPAHDVTVTGTFTVNNYTLTYMVDGEVYKTLTIAYGSDLTPEEAPTKAGFTFSGWEGLPETMPAHDVTVTGAFYIYGDVNIDNEVDLLDVVDIARFTVGTPAETFKVNLADLNLDNMVNITDAVVLINEIAGNQNFVKELRPGAGYNYETCDLELLGYKDNRLSLCLIGETDFTAFQCTMDVPEGLSITGLYLNSSRADGHQLLYNRMKDGSYRIVALSLTNNVFGGTEGELLSVKLDGEASDEVSVRDIHFVTTKGTAFAFDDIGQSNNTETGIGSIDSEMVNGKSSNGKSIYDLQGRQRQALQRGVYIVNGKKVIVK